MSFLNGRLYRRQHPKRPKGSPHFLLFLIIYDAYINHAKDISNNNPTTSLSFVCLLLLPPGCLCFCFVCLKKRKMELVGGGKLTRWLSGNDRWPFPSGRHLSERWRNCSASWRCWGASAIQTCWANRQRKRKTSKNYYCPDERKIWENAISIRTCNRYRIHPVCVRVCRFGTFWKARVKKSKQKSRRQRAEYYTHNVMNTKGRKSEWKGRQ